MFYEINYVMKTIVLYHLVIKIKYIPIAINIYMNDLY